jgi:hypothetical protein
MAGKASYESELLSVFVRGEETLQVYSYRHEPQRLRGPHRCCER